MFNIFISQKQRIITCLPKDEKDKQLLKKNAPNISVKRNK